MSVNQISQDIIDGSNHTNINVNGVFHDLIGAALRTLTVQTFITETTSGPYFRQDVRQFRRYQFWTGLPGDFGFSITQHGGAWYSVELRNQNHFTHDGNKIHQISLKFFNKAYTNVKQILIVEGHDYSSYFWINPVKILDVPSENDHDSIDEYVTEEISIDEDDVSEFLYYFLEKHFDSQIQVTGRKKNEKRSFEWNLEHNIYTYESVTKIIAEIRATANLFIDDFDNQALSKIKERFSLSTIICEDFTCNASGEFDQHRDEIIRENIGIVIDFYERFCRRMELMMEHAPQYNLISFMGP
jgi:hypothetical protein